MFFILAKILFYVAMPIVWIIAVLAYAFFSKNDSRRKTAVGIALIMILFFSNAFIINELFVLWEKPPVPMKQISKYDYAIVLTGVTNTQKSAFNDRVFFNKGADRVLHTIQLYREGKVKKIIISGGSSSLSGEGVREANQLKKVFIDCDIPPSDLIIENNSRNTRENALYTKKLVDSLHLQGKFLLITSAFHMRRAEGCFKKAGMRFDIYPVDIYTRDRKFTPDNLLIPQESALGKWAVLIHETLGYLTYSIMGYC